jgi:hypothetical protein
MRLSEDRERKDPRRALPEKWVLRLLQGLWLVPSDSMDRKFHGISMEVHDDASS